MFSSPLGASAVQTAAHTPPKLAQQELFTRWFKLADSGAREVATAARPPCCCPLARSSSPDSLCCCAILSPYPRQRWPPSRR